MKPSTARKPLFAAIALATALSAPSVFAQSDEERFALEEVVVTARRRSESLQDVAIDAYYDKNRGGALTCDQHHPDRVHPRGGPAGPPGRI